MIKNIIVIVVCATSLQANAQISDQALNECKVQIQQDFVKFKAAAEYLAVPNWQDFIHRMTMQFMDTEYIIDGARLVGYADWDTDVVHYDADAICNDNPTTRPFVVAHEIGHILSYTDRAELRNNGYLKLAPTLLEHFGNEYGAKLFRITNTDSTAFLSFTDSICNQKRQFFCDRAESWRIGLKY